MLTDTLVKAEAPLKELTRHNHETSQMFLKRGLSSSLLSTHTFGSNWYHAAHSVLSFLATDLNPKQYSWQWAKSSVTTKGLRVTYAVPLPSQSSAFTLSQYPVHPFTLHFQLSFFLDTFSTSTPFAPYFHIASCHRTFKFERLSLPVQRRLYD